MLTIGAHMSIAKGIAKAAENVIEMQANTMQIFSRNPRGSSYKDYSRAEVDNSRHCGKTMSLERCWPMRLIR